MNADDMRALQDARRNGGRCAKHSLVFRNASEGAPDKAFARWAYKDRKTQTRELREAGNQLVVLGETLTEADAGIENQLGFWDPAASRPCGSFFQALCNIAYHVSCEWGRLHRSRRP